MVSATVEPRPRDTNTGRLHREIVLNDVSSRVFRTYADHSGRRSLLVANSTDYRKPNETTSPRDNPVHDPARHEDVAVEYVNLKECRSIFSAANEIHLELTGEKVGAYEGLDGAFTGIWDALAAYPA